MILNNGGIFAKNNTVVGVPVIGGTANCVLYINSSGNLACDADLTFDGTTLTSKKQVINNGTTLSPALTVSGKSDGGYLTCAPLVIYNSFAVPERLFMLGGSGSEGQNDYGQVVMLGGVGQTGQYAIWGDFMWGHNALTSDKRGPLLRAFSDVVMTTVPDATASGFNATQSNNSQTYIIGTTIYYHIWYYLTDGVNYFGTTYDSQSITIASQGYYSDVSPGIGSEISFTEDTTYTPFSQGTTVDIYCYFYKSYGGNTYWSTTPSSAQIIIADVGGADVRMDISSFAGYEGMRIWYTTDQASFYYFDTNYASSWYIGAGGNFTYGGGSQYGGTPNLPVDTDTNSYDVALDFGSTSPYTGYYVERSYDDSTYDYGGFGSPNSTAYDSQFFGSTDARTNSLPHNVPAGSYYNNVSFKLVGQSSEANFFNQMLWKHTGEVKVGAFSDGDTPLAMLEVVSPDSRRAGHFTGDFIQTGYSLFGNSDWSTYYDGNWKTTFTGDASYGYTSRMKNTNAAGNAMFKVENYDNSLSALYGVDTSGFAYVDASNAGGGMEVRMLSNSSLTTVRAAKVIADTGADTDIWLSFAAQGTTYNFISLNGSTTEGAGIGLIGGATSDPNLYLNCATTGDILFRTGTTGAYNEKARLLNNGRFGILTGAPDKLLHVSTSATNEGAHIGTAFVGVSGFGSNYAAFNYFGVQYALLQQNDGSTFLNSATGKITSFRINNADVAQLYAGNFWLVADSNNLLFGTGKDSSITFDGNSLNIVANAVTATDTLELTAGTINANSDTVFVGTGTGLPYGSFYGNEIAFSTGALTAPAYKIIADTDCVTGEVNLVTYTDAGTTLTISKAGRYKIDWAVSAEAGTANVHILGGIMIDSTTVLQAAGRNHTETTIANRQLPMSGTAIINCPNGTEVIGVGVGSDVDNITVTVDHVNLSIVQVGG